MSENCKPIRMLAMFGCVALLLGGIRAQAQQNEFQVDRAKSTVTFTLGDVLHTVHGTFKVSHGTLQVEPGGKASGEIVVDARSGESGSGMRDRKMNKEVLESAKYPEISFRPNRIDGLLNTQGNSTVMVHGMFGIHGAEREITVPAKVEMSPEGWTASVHFTVPYAKWGMKNPSTLFLRVSDTVEIDLMVAGTVGRSTAKANQHPANQ